MSCFACLLVVQFLGKPNIGVGLLHKKSSLRFFYRIVILMKISESFWVNKPKIGPDWVKMYYVYFWAGHIDPITRYLLANPIFRWIGYKLIFIPDDEWIFRWFHAASRANKSIRQQTGSFPPDKEFPIFPFSFLIQAERVCFRTKINGRVAFITTKRQLPRRRRKKLSKEEDCYRSIETYTAGE